jgi:hypothetical protein
MIKITAFMTNNGAPYSSYVPLISIWNASTNANIVSSTAMTLVGSSIYKYDFTTFNYGVHYVYQITGDPTVNAIERYQWGICFQEVPDRIIGSVQTNVSNSPTQFQSDRTESTTDYWKNALCLFLSGSLVGQVQKVTGYNSTTFILTFTNGFTGTPSNGDTYELINF